MGITSKFMLASDELEKKCSDTELIESLVELYSYNFKKSHDADRENQDEFYNIGRTDGAVDALSAVLLKVLGGREMYNLWQRVIDWADKTGEPSTAEATRDGSEKDPVRQGYSNSGTN